MLDNMNLPAMIGGEIAWTLDGDNRVNVNAMRPFLDDDGQPSIVINAAGDVLNTNAALLRHEEWLDIDRRVTQVMSQRLVGIADLRSRNLVHRLGSIGQTVTMWQQMSDMTQANINMDGVTAGEEDTLAFSTAQVPVPIIHKDWRLNMRRLAASRMHGEALDTLTAAVAARLVAEASERMLFSGAPITVDGSTIYGYRNFPGRAGVDLTTPWTSASPAQIKADVAAMLAAARARRFFGPFTLYIPGEWEGVLDEFYTIGDADSGITVPGRTIRDVLLSLSGLERIVVADMMGTAAEAVLVSLDIETVDLAIAQEPTTISWQVMGGMQERFKTFAAWVPRLKSDFDGRCGIVHLYNIP